MLVLNQNALPTLQLCIVARKVCNESAQAESDKCTGVLQVVVSLRSLLQDRMAALNGRTVEYVLKQDKQAFIRLIGLSIAQVSTAVWPMPAVTGLLICHLYVRARPGHLGGGHTHHRRNIAKSSVQI